MGEDKAFIELNGVPLWRRQLQILQELAPRELFIAGPPHEEWRGEGHLIIPDAQRNAGPLGGLVAALRRCSAPLLLTLAVDLPHMTSDYLRDLIAGCSRTRGIIPRAREHFETVAAVYPTSALPLAEMCLMSDKTSLQSFAARSLFEDLVTASEIGAEDKPLFLNINTPEDLSSVAAVGACTERSRSDRRTSNACRRNSAVTARRYK